MENRVFYRRLGHAYPTVVRGEGIYLYGTDGKRYLDASGGSVVVNIGHGVVGDLIMVAPPFIILD